MVYFIQYFLFLLCRNCDFQEKPPPNTAAMCCPFFPPDRLPKQLINSQKAGFAVEIMHGNKHGNNMPIQLKISA